MHTHAVSARMTMSFDCGERELAQLSVEFIVRPSGSAGFSLRSEHYFAYFSHPRRCLQSKHLGHPRFPAKRLGSTMKPDRLPPLKSLLRLFVLCLNLIRFLSHCQSKSPLDPRRRNRLVPKWPSTTDHQPLSTAA